MKGQDNLVRAADRVAAGIERLSDRIGRLAAWLTLTMVLAMVTVVVLRYLFGLGGAWLTESVTWMHAFVFMLGAAYALRHDEHVRVDVFYRGWSVRRQAWVNLLGTLLFLLPFCGWVMYSSVPYVVSSWSIRETSREAGGLPALYVLKALIPLAMALLALQGVALALRSVAQLLPGSEEPRS